MHAFRLAGWGSALLTLVATAGCGTVQVEPDADPSVTIDGGAATDGGPGSPDASPVVQGLAASPTTVEFGILLINTESVAATVQFTNTGTVSTGGLSRQLAGADPGQFSIDSDTCNGAVLDPNESCEVNIKFTPSAVGDKVGALVVSDSVVRAEVPLRGTALAPGALTLNPSTHTFPSTVVGSDSETQVFTVENTGGVVSGAVTVNLSDTANFAITADTCNGNAVGAGATCSITARFSPGASGSQVGSISATASPGGSAVASLGGVGLAPAALELTPSTEAFGAAVVGGRVSKTFTLKNAGDQTSGVPGISLTGSGTYSIATNNCTAALAGGATCTIVVDLAPTVAASSLTATLTASASPGGSDTSTLSGSAITPALLTISPTSKNFGNVVIGEAPTQVFTVRNTGGQTSGTVGASITGSNKYSISASTCNSTLANNATCTVTIKFAPTAAGSVTGTLTASASPGGSAAASLSGTGLTPANLSLSLSSHAFGNVTLGSSKTQPFTLTNTGNQGSGTVSVTASGDSSYSVTSNTCTAALAGGASCTFSVKFGPTTAGAKNGSVTAVATPGGSVSATLTGTGQVVNYTLTVVSRHDPGASGTVTSSPAGITCASLSAGRTCTASFASGTTVTLTKSPGTGTNFSVFSGDCSGTGPTCSVTMTGNKSVTAEFFGLLL